MEFLGAWVGDSAQLYEAVGPRDGEGRQKKVSTSCRYYTDGLTAVCSGSATTLCCGRSTM